MSDGNGANGGSSTRDGSRNRNKKSILPLVIGLPLIAVLAAAAIYFTTTSGNETTQTNEPAQSETGAGDEARTEGSQDEQASSEDALPMPSLGDADAPVVMQEFSDYQ